MWDFLTNFSNKNNYDLDSGIILPFPWAHGIFPDGVNLLQLCIVCDWLLAITRSGSRRIIPHTNILKCFSVSDQRYYVFLQWVHNLKHFTLRSVTVLSSEQTKLNLPCFCSKIFWGLSSWCVIPQNHYYYNNKTFFRVPFLFKWTRKKINLMKYLFLNVFGKNYKKIFA